MEDVKDKITLKNELLRKAIHLSSSVIPIVYYFLSREIELIILGAMVVLLVTIDILRITSPWMRDLYLKVLKPILRTHEVDNRRSLFSGGTYIVIGFFICVLIFPKPLAITSMLVIIICDSFAAIIGKVYGRHFIKNKTLEGSAAFFLSGAAVIMLTPKMTQDVSEYYIGFISVFFTSVFELLPFKIDDNIIIPVFFGMTYYIILKVAG